MKKLIANKRREIFVVSFSFFITLSLLVLTRFIDEQRTRVRMLEGSSFSSRVSDGARNLIVLNGRSGYIGLSSVKADFLSEGFVHIYGFNRTDNLQWKKLCTVRLEPGEYSFDGLSCSKNEIVKLQLNYPGSKGKKTIWHYQWDGEIIFYLEEEKQADLYIMVYPNAEIDELARPTLYYNGK